MVDVPNSLEDFSTYVDLFCQAVLGKPCENYFQQNKNWLQFPDTNNQELGFKFLSLLACICQASLCM